MGELATPSAAARAETRALCESILQAVEEDERMPLPFGEVTTQNHNRAYLRADVLDLVTQIAMEVRLQADDLGHSQRFLAAELAVNDRHRETNRKALDLLGIKYPGLCNEYVWGGGIVEGIEDLQRQLAAMTAARDEACDLADEGWAYAGDYFRDKWQATPQIEALRQVGTVDQLRRGK